MAKIKVLVLIPLVVETKNFVTLSPKKAGLSLWQCLLRGCRPVKNNVSITVKNVGVRAFCELDSLPSVFDKITLPVITHGKESSIPLVVTKVMPPPKKPSSPFLVYAAFDIGFSRDHMNVCSKRDVFGNIEPTYAWLFGHGTRLTELRQSIDQGHTTGLTTWYKEKTILIEAL